ncbi:MAG TPA: TrmH family RNA methyltransferase, partial [Elusimicrobiota bacterium]|nr:TrmH family RNA methyltransferase [Elusimicrobiota bacterium]
MNVVLVEPEIHFNTGNIGRTCVGTKTTLHLVGKLGFSLDEKEIRRGGLDYWPKLDLRLHASWTAFLQAAGPDPSLLLFSAEA